MVADGVQGQVALCWHFVYDKGNFQRIIEVGVDTYHRAGLV